MNHPNRFQDENLILSNFYDEVLVVCPVCSNKAIAKANFEFKEARLFCGHCGYNKTISTESALNAVIKMPAHQFFDAPLWVQSAFKSKLVWAYNDNHLEFLERSSVPPCGNIKTETIISFWKNCRNFIM